MDTEIKMKKKYFQENPKNKYTMTITIVIPGYCTTLKIMGFFQSSLIRIMIMGTFTTTINKSIRKKQQNKQELFRRIFQK